MMRQNDYVNMRKSDVDFPFLSFYNEHEKYVYQL